MHLTRRPSFSLLSIFSFPSSIPNSSFDPTCTFCSIVTLDTRRTSRTSNILRDIKGKRLIRNNNEREYMSGVCEIDRETRGTRSSWCVFKSWGTTALELFPVSPIVPQFFGLLSYKCRWCNKFIINVFCKISCLTKIRQNHKVAGLTNS